MIVCPYCGYERQGRNSCPSCGRVDLDALKSINVSYEVNPRRMNDVPPSRPNNSFERGIRRDSRGVPYLDKNGSPLRMKESFKPADYGENPVKISTGDDA